jgi:hypothetical protein
MKNLLGRNKEEREKIPQKPRKKHCKEKLWYELNSTA